MKVLMFKRWKTLVTKNILKAEVVFYYLCVLKEKVKFIHINKKDKVKWYTQVNQRKCADMFALVVIIV